VDIASVNHIGGDDERQHDEQLAVEARTSSSAFEELYLRHRDAVFAYLRAWTGDEDAALELTAITFERAFSAIGGYRSRGLGPRAWLLRIGRNAAIDDQRRRRRTPQGQAPDDLEATDVSVEEASIAADERRAIRGLVATLPQPQRDALALRYASGLAAREIGALIGKSEAATQKLLSRALQTLREAYDGHD
jgi:RNA polymerase sigma-70 factor, ECF subfamily